MDTVPNFSSYSTVGEAAAFLGVSAATLRNWDRSGKLKPRRHPQNGYRIYLHEELAALLRSTDSSLPETAGKASTDWDTIGDSEHFVQFYETDEFLVESVSGFVAAALCVNGSGLIVATREHRDAIHEKLASAGIDVAEAIEAGQIVSLDAAETLDRICNIDQPDAGRFVATIGSVLAELVEGGRKVHAFGEMVALLWQRGDREAAIQLEALWNDLAKHYRFSLFCGYSMSRFECEEDGAAFESVCGCHSRVLPTETYSALADPDQRLRAVTSLQQKAHALEAEIAHRVAVEKSLAERQRELDDFFENATEGLHKVGADGRILWANRAEYSGLGYTASEYIGRPISEFHADADVIETILIKLRQGETLQNFPARLQCKNGAIRHVLISSNAHFEDGEFVYTRCFTRDVTRQWQAEQALREADRMKDEFLATLAHELRNPLAPIKSGLQLVRLNGSDETVSHEVLNIIERQVDQMTRLVDDLLDVRRITRGTIELRKERVDLAAVVNSAVETSAPLIGAAGHQLTIDLPSQPIVLDVDRTRLAQVFSNLLNNSAKYTEPGGRIEIVAELQGTAVTVTFRDNGLGIPHEELARVFDMFQQGDRSKSRAQGGVGIGLTLVRRLVELHDGSVSARSEGAGKGSEFVVRLPVVCD